MKPSSPGDLNRECVRVAMTGGAAFVARYLRLHVRHFAILAALVVCAAAAAVTVQLIMKLLVDGMASGRDDPGRVWWPLVGFISLIAAESLLWRLSGWIGCRATVAAGVDMRHDLFKHVSRQPMRYFTDHMAGALGQRITSTAGHFGALVNTVVWRIVPPVIDFVGATIIFSAVDGVISSGLGFAVLLTTGGLVFYGQRGRGLHKEYARSANQIGGDLVDVLANMWSVKAFSAQRRESKRLRLGFEQEASAQRASWMHIERARVLHDLGLLLTAGLVLVYAIHLWIEKQITPGDVVMVSALTFRILHGSRDIALSIVEMVQQFSFIDETLRVIGTECELDQRAELEKIVLPGCSIEFRNVSFSYERGHEALSQISVFIPQGQKVGIVGKSGAGKSTIIHLLQRLHEPSSGTIEIGARDVRSMSQESLRAHLAVIPQDIGLFHRSVLENIRIARPDADDAEVHAAARAAQCSSFISRLPHGLDTFVGERGARLSGGQRQRIGIARALLMHASIIIMDEATSALDSETERDVLNSLADLAADKTVISVAHRLSALANFERILVIDDGRIVEDGTFSELRRAGGLFEEMWRRQANASLIAMRA
ncbi:MAG: ABC-type multidrug transport system, ATPase and permease component [Hyphomicrobiales bacterium]|nr:ABC-type multidrug transport system, ATPase and permease component [Hyphomicrobiales bacterium]